VGGFAVAAFAHLFQPGTLEPELLGIFRHPIWTARAESVRAARDLRDLAALRRRPSNGATTGEWDAKPVG
jgi:hypothetical protein